MIITLFSSFFYFYLIYLYVYFLRYNHLLYHDLMNYLLYICMPICCMTLVNKDNVKCNEAALCLTQNLHDKKFVTWVNCVYIIFSNFWISQLILHFQKRRIWRKKIFSKNYSTNSQISGKKNFLMVDVNMHSLSRVVVPATLHNISVNAHFTRFL